MSAHLFVKFWERARDSRTNTVTPDTFMGAVAYLRDNGADRLYVRALAEIGENEKAAGESRRLQAAADSALRSSVDNLEEGHDFPGSFNKPNPNQEADESVEPKPDESVEPVEP